MSSGQISALKNASLYDANFERQVSLFMLREGESRQAPVAAVMVM